MIPKVISAKTGAQVAEMKVYNYLGSWKDLVKKHIVPGMYDGHFDMVSIIKCIYLLTHSW